LNLFQTSLSSPVGIYKIVSNAHAIVSIHFLGNTIQGSYDSTSNEILQLAIQQIEEYFQGTRKEFTIPFELSGTSLLQKVYQTLAQVPYGSTIKYGDLAKKAGIDKGGRFAGNAMARNPLPIVIPCHRVIRGDGSIGNYSSGGENVKRWLINWEISHVGREEL